MRPTKSTMRRSLGAALGLILASGGLLAAPTSLGAAPTAQAPANSMVLSVGRGRLVNLSAPMSDLFVADEKVADVQVRSPTQLYVFAKAKGETSVYATSKSGAVVYSTNVRVGNNLEGIDGMLGMAMPDADIRATPMNGLILLTGTVAGPEDGAEAERLVQAFVGDDVKVVSRLKTATPLQVNVQVKIAEVSRSLLKEIGTNLLTRDTTGGFQFNVAQGRNFTSIGPTDFSNLPKIDVSTSKFGLPAGTIPPLPYNPNTGQAFLPGTGSAADFKNLALGAGQTALGFFGHLFGIDVASALDLAETDGLVTTLAQPNLTALSGETASFLAGGEFPIPISQQLGQVTIEYKQFGVSLAFTPTVLSDGRISMRIRPEVSELSTEGAVQLNGFSVPALTTRRAETTVELGSGQAFMIGGLLRNISSTTLRKAPGLGDVPILGTLFRSSRFQRSETELVIIVTPYLVRPVSAGDIKLPTDGFKTATDFQRVIGGQSFSGQSGAQRPIPTMAPPVSAQPRVGALTVPVTPTTQASRKVAKNGVPAPAPGFSFNR